VIIVGGQLTLNLTLDKAWCVQSSDSTISCVALACCFFQTAQPANVMWL
jgi:hypothetical protein